MNRFYPGANGDVFGAAGKIHMIASPEKNVVTSCTDVFPRLLLLSQVVPQTMMAGSIVLHRLLADYPPGRLLVVGGAAEPAAELLRCRYELMGIAGQRLQRTRFAHLVRSLRCCRLLPGPSLSRRVRGAIAKFQPEVVLTLMETQPYYCLAWRFAVEHRLPLVLIIHDLPEEFEPVYPWARARSAANNAAVYLSAARRLCVSPEMCDHLEQVYGVRGHVLYPNRAPDLVARPPEKCRQLREPGRLTVGYAGSLAYGYGDQIRAMLPAFKATGSRLRLYTAARPNWIDETVCWRGYAATAATTWQRVKDECDAVLLPYSWDDPKLHKLYRTHFPSKMTEYLALGMPMLLCGPEYATGIRWGLAHGEAALTITQNDPLAWAAALTRLRDDAALRYALATGGLEVGDKEFSPQVICEQFLMHLRAAVQEKKVI